MDTPNLSEAALQRNAQLLQQAFKGKIRRPQPGTGLVAALFITALVMVLLPVMYVLFVLVIGGMVVMYAVVGASLIGGVPGGFYVRFILYVAPLLAGILTVIFMLKPLFARHPPPPPAREVRPQDEPLLFEFLYAVCNSLGAPCPVRVEVELECNASASFRRGFLSFFHDDLVLRLGIPLIEGLPIQEFASVIAHEFGHFTQRTSMRLHYIVWRINRWFWRVVYERDNWDARLEQSSADAGCLIALTNLIARFAIYLSRGVLWCFMSIGHIVSCYTSRQMEYHADACSACFAGSEAFVRSMQRTRVLSLADSLAAEYMVECLRRRNDPGVKVPANYAKVVTRFANEIMEKTGGRGVVSEEKPSIFDNHPSCEARIERVRSLGENGVFHLKGPATTLFRDFERLTKRMSKERALEIAPFLR